MRRALACVLLLLGCGGDPAPQPEQGPGPIAVGTTERLDAPFEGIYTDALRVVSVTFDSERGYRGVLEDNTVPGWSEPHATALAAREGKLTGVLDDRHHTELSLESQGDVLTLGTWRRGRENPRSHELARVEADAWAGALETYDRAFPNKTVDTPRRKGELLTERARQLRADDPAAAAELLDAAATLFWPKRDVVAVIVHTAGLCWLPSENPEGDWEQAAARFERAAELRRVDAREAPGLRGAVGDDDGLAASLLNLAHCRNPNFNPAGQLERAEALYAEAAEVALRDEKPALRRRAQREQALCISQRAIASIGNDRAAMTPAARELLLEARRLAREAQDPELLKVIGSWLR